MKMERSSITLIMYWLVTGILFVGYASSDDASPTITIEQGTLVGHIYNTSYGSYYAFQGIPYAKPPVGDLRFKAPVAPDPWTGTYQATEERSQCTQAYSPYVINVTGSEDCLFLNVYISQLPDEKNLLPVMVWIHGGGFVIGSGNLKWQGPEFFLNDGVIYVSINYRLSILGFLSTQDEVAPGNAAMKDQVMALRWVQKNIAAFGGDPNKVTIFGESGGGASVSLHVLSPMSAGLFRSAISQSGSSMNPFATRRQDLARDVAFYVGRAFGYTGNSSKELVDIMRTKTASELVTAVNENIPEMDRNRLTAFTFPPVVEPDVEGEESFLPDIPTNILSQGKFNDVYFLTGTNSGESLLFVQNKGLLDGSTPASWADEHFVEIVKPDLRYCKTDPCGDEMVAKIKSFYFGNESVSSGNLQALVNMATDLFMAEGTVYSVDKMASLGSKRVYLYELSYLGEITTKGDIPGASKFEGVPHGDDVLYLFDTGATPPTGSRDALMRQYLPAMWTNFAKTGNPTPDNTDDLPTWLPYTSSEKYYLSIDSELTVKTNVNKERMDFWKELYSSS